MIGGQYHCENLSVVAQNYPPILPLIDVNRVVEGRRLNGFWKV
jgi:hypothetical protein